MGVCERYGRDVRKEGEMLGIGYYPMIYFKMADRKGGPNEATFDKVLCKTKEEALAYSRRIIEDIRREIPEDCVGMVFQAGVLDTTKRSSKERALIALLLSKS